MRQQPPHGVGGAAGQDPSCLDANPTATTITVKQKLQGAYVKTAPLSLGALGLQEQQQQQQQQALGYSFLTLPGQRINLTATQPGKVSSKGDACCPSWCTLCCLRRCLIAVVRTYPATKVYLRQGDLRRC